IPGLPTNGPPVVVGLPGPEAVVAIEIVDIDVVVAVVVVAVPAVIVPARRRTAPAGPAIAGTAIDRRVEAAMTPVEPVVIAVDQASHHHAGGEGEQARRHQIAGAVARLR